MENITVIINTAFQSDFVLLNLGWPSKAVLVAIFCMFGASNVLIRSHYVHFIYKYTPNYPVNLLLAFDQISVGLASFVVFFFHLLSLATSTPVKVIFGGSTIPCELARMAGRAYFAFKACNGLGLASYRIVMLKIGQPKKAGLKIIASSMVLSIAACWAHYQGSLNSRLTNGEEFCTGHSDVMNEILGTYEDSLQDETLKATGKAWQVSAIAVMIVVEACQVGIYVWIAWYRYNQDKSVVGMISNSNLKKRQKSTMITFAGQAFICCLDTFGLLIFQLFLFRIAIPLKPIFVLCVTFESAFLAFSQWISSPEILRRMLNVSV